mmetsp:Transcript_165149/g.530039  ORF Transcript_165149/g.530039 Transcript_165149/m.530039 type:complete len:205 (-) Transcript_165149:1045-1659(-)
MCDASFHLPEVQCQERQIQRPRRAPQTQDAVDELRGVHPARSVRIQQLEEPLRIRGGNLNGMESLLHLWGVHQALEQMPRHGAADAVGHALEELPDVVDQELLFALLRGLQHVLDEDAGHGIHQGQRAEADVEAKGKDDVVAQVIAQRLHQDVPILAAKQSLVQRQHAQQQVPVELDQIIDIDVGACGPDVLPLLEDHLRDQQA